MPELLDRSLRSALDDLHEAREALKSARRRVVQLEDVVAYWQEATATVRHRCADEPTVT